MQPMLSTSRSIPWLASLLLAGFSTITASAYDDLQRAYDDADARARAVQYTLKRDQADLAAARARVDDLSTARERQMRTLADLKDAAPQPDHTQADLDRAAKDKAALADQIKSLQQAGDAAKAKADQLHADALAKFESTDAFKSNYAAFDQARQELKVPTDAVLDQLAQTRAFQDLVESARAAKAAEDKLQADKSADPKALKAAEDAFVAADNKVQDMEEQALTADPKVIAGRQKVDAAQAKLRDMRDRMEDDLKNDPSFAAAVGQLTKTDAALAAALSDQKKLDAQIAQLQTSLDKQPPTATAPADNRAALHDAEARLDAINDDLERATADLAKFQARVDEDQDGYRSAERNRAAAADPIGYGPAPLDQPQEIVSYSPYVPIPVAAVPVFAPPICQVPAYTYGYGYGYSSGIYLGFGYSSYRDHSYYGRYYDHDYDRFTRTNGYHTDWQDSSRRNRLADESRLSSELRSERLRDQAYTDHLAYRERKDLHDTQVQADRSAYQDRKEVRAQEELHARRAAEDAARSEARQSRHSTPITPEPQFHESSARSAHSSPPDRPSRDIPARDTSSHVQHSAPPPETSSHTHTSNSSNNSTDSPGASHGHTR